jgi:hypothetical protein
MFFTKEKKYKVKTYRSYREIAEALSWGRTWKEDPLYGIFDNLYHPTRIQKNILTNRSVGDCDDHAIFWCVSLLKSGLAKSTWLSSYQYEKRDGKVSGHVVCVFEDHEENVYWADYGLPEKIKTRTEWVFLMKTRKSRKVLGGTEISIEGLKSDDTPIFGKIRRIS